MIAKTRQEKRDMKKRAWEVAHALSIWSNTPITPAMLLDEPKPQVIRATDFATPEAFLAAAAAAVPDPIGPPEDTRELEVDHA
jgi:hypothetical protein